MCSNLSGTPTDAISITSGRDPSPDPTSPELIKSIPFTGLLEIEDECGVQQRVQIDFELEVASTGFNQGETRVLTETRETKITLGFEGPTIGNEPIRSLPRTPHLHARRLFIKISPSVESGEYEYILAEQYPNMGFLDTLKVTNIQTKGIAITAVGSLSPSLAAQVNIQSGSSVERIPLSRAVGRDFRINKSGGSHYWDYPLTGHNSYSTFLSLPPLYIDSQIPSHNASHRDNRFSRSLS